MCETYPSLREADNNTSISVNEYISHNGLNLPKLRELKNTVKMSFTDLPNFRNNKYPE
jgi:hypothetical protein